jgi:hypothetical protein
VTGPVEEGKTTVWWCECKCGFRQTLTRKDIRFRRFHKPNVGCQECWFAAMLGKGNIKHTEADKLEVMRRKPIGNKGARNRFAKYGKGDRLDNNRRLNEARLKIWAERAARGESKGQPRAWSMRFRNRVELLKLELEESKHATKN